MWWAGRERALPWEPAFLDDPAGRVLVAIAAWTLATLVVNAALAWGIRALVRRIRGDLDDLLLGAIRPPLVALLALYGMHDALAAAGVPQDSFWSRLPVAAAYLVIALALSKSVRILVARHAQSPARRAEKRLDDIVVHIAGLVGPLFLFAAATLLSLSLFGFSLTEVLIGGGIIALVLGFALQDTLSNFFSGVGLLIDGPFAVDDLILLPGGRICRVNRVGARSTELYVTADHATIYLSNRDLAGMQIVNLTRPSQDLVVSVPFRVALHADLDEVRALVTDIATRHPHAVLYSDAEAARRSHALEASLRTASLPADLRRKVCTFLARDVAYRELTTRVEALRSHIIVASEDILKGLNESGGVHARTGALLLRLCVLAARVSAVRLPGDAWGREAEQAAEARRREALNAALVSKVHELVAIYNSDNEAKRARLLAELQEFGGWLVQAYHKVPDEWQAATVTFEGYGVNWIDLHLRFCVYNITYENFGRRDRVVTEVAFEIHEMLRARGWIGAYAGTPPGERVTAPAPRDLRA